MKLQIYQSTGLNANNISHKIRRIHKHKAHRKFRHQTRIALGQEEYDSLPYVISTGWAD